MGKEGLAGKKWWPEGEDESLDYYHHAPQKRGKLKEGGAAGKYWAKRWQAFGRRFLRWIRVEGLSGRVMGASNVF